MMPLLKMQFTYLFNKHLLSYDMLFIVLVTVHIKIKITDVLTTLV